MPDIPWPPKVPRVLIVVSMKNEGPYLLEWLSWHKAIGVTDFVVFTNHCEDGTDLMLDRLDAIGEVTHLPNPALLSDIRAYQPAALTYAHQMPLFKRADFILSMDADEFVNVRVPGYRLPDLLASVPAFDALSINELNHGVNGYERIEDVWLTETRLGHIKESPRKRRAFMGVKTLTRNSGKFERIGNHRPYIAEGADVVWLDGSGNQTDRFRDPEKNGSDARGRFDLVSLDHFALRSVDAFLLKHRRGDAVTRRRNVTEKYWRTRNRSEAQTSDLAPGAKLARDVHARYAADAELIRLHEAAVETHRRWASTLKGDPDLQTLRDYIYRTASADTRPVAAE